MNEKPTINGTIHRLCQVCGKEDDCNCFDDSEPRILCPECTFDKYGIGKPKRKRLTDAEYDFCKSCDTMTMRRDNKNNIITETHVIHHFSCDYCGKTMKRKIKKWKK